MREFARAEFERYRHIHDLVCVRTYETLAVSANGLIESYQIPHFGKDDKVGACLNVLCSHLSSQTGKTQLDSMRRYVEQIAV